MWLKALFGALLKPAHLLRKGLSMTFIRPSYLVIALFAGTVAAGPAFGIGVPMGGGGVSISQPPRPPTVRPPTVSVPSVPSGVDAARAGADAARGAGTGSAAFGGTVGGMDNAPNWDRGGGAGGQTDRYGMIAGAGAGGSMSGAPNPGSGGGRSGVDDYAEGIIFDIVDSAMNTKAPGTNSGSGGKSGSGGNSGSGGKVASTGGKAPTASPSPTASPNPAPSPVAGNPVDPLAAQAEHDAAVAARTAARNAEYELEAQQRAANDRRAEIWNKFMSGGTQSDADQEAINKQPGATPADKVKHLVEQISIDAEKELGPKFEQVKRDYKEADKKVKNTNKVADGVHH